MGCKESFLWSQNSLLFPFHLFCILLQVGAGGVSVRLCTPEQTSHLLQFKTELAFNKTVYSSCPDEQIISSPSSKLDSWKEGSDDCCSWDGIICNTVTGQVVGIDLGCSGLQGTIHSNSSLFRYFSALQTLRLSWNDIRLEEHGFQLLAQNFTNLRFLDLNQVNISSSIPISLLNRTYLTHLSLRSCGLHGEFPAEIFSNLVNLRVLDVGGNHALTGKLPDTVGKMNYLEKLYIFDNQFDGSIPVSLGNLTQLIYFIAYYNDFTGPLHSSNITGLQKLSYFWISYNHINGVIPSWLFSLPSLEYLYIQHNNLKGRIGEFRSKSLTYIDMSYNDLHGAVPSSSFRHLQSLTVLHLDSNNLSGTLDPGTFCSATKLEILNLSNNNLSGAIPECLGNFSQSLVVLYLPKNNFSGTIPDTFVAGNSLKIINLSGNRLEGPLPRSMGNCKGLEMLDLGKNNINDSFPNWLGELPNLHFLSLQSNKLHGTIGEGKTTMMIFAQLHILDMSDNELMGHLPANYFATFTSMMAINHPKSSAPQYMRYDTADGRNFFLYNSFFVTIKGTDTELRKVLTTERFIDLSQNKFEGGIPKSIGKLQSLRGLNLSHNRFEGRIPTTLANLTSLEWLDLSSNKLAGEIPQQLTKLDFLQSIDLSWNQLSGHVPRGTHFDTFPNDSYTGNPALCGFPLTNMCSDSKPLGPEQEDDDLEDSPSLFGWKEVVVGYACGLLVGLGTGCLMFALGKPRWLVMIIETELHAIKTRFSNP